MSSNMIYWFSQKQSIWMIAYGVSCVLESSVTMLMHLGEKWDHAERCHDEIFTWRLNMNYWALHEEV